MNGLYETKVDRIKVGRKYLGIGSRLIGLNIKPKDNWVVHFELNGVPEKTDGVTWYKAINSMNNILERNGVENALSIAWITCNIRWMEQTPSQYHIVPLDYLLSISQKIGFVSDDSNPVEDAKEDMYRPPLIWGSHTWDYMGYDLSFETATLEGFKELANKVLVKLDKRLNPSRGCLDCYNHFKKNVLKLEKDVNTLEEAKRWLLDSHNEVNKLNNKRVFSMEDAKKRYGWK